MSFLTLFKMSLKKMLVFTLTLALLFTSYAPLFQTPFTPQEAYAANACTTGNSKSSPMKIASKPYARVGGVSLDQAAKFLADMTDITGAYYDSSLDRIVFVGKKNTNAPKFDRDDLAVAIKTVVYNKSLPQVNLDTNDLNDGVVDITLSPGLEDTRFGKVLIDADYKLKQYIHGKDQNGNTIISSVSTYKPAYQRYSEKGPTPNASSTNAWWITPKEVTIKKDDAANAFVFNTAIMEVKTVPQSPNNDPKMNEAAQEFATDMTINYDNYAQEIPQYFEVKQLGKIVSVIKWIDDAGIATDFEWARDYTPKKVATPRKLPQITSYWPTFQATGGVNYQTDNTYNPDNGTAASLKASSQSVSTAKEDTHWTFTNGGQQYEAVAVTADAFRSMGSYNTASTDMAFPTAGDLTLAFQRVYSSFSGGQNGIGNGWSILPAVLYDNNPTADPFVCGGTTYIKSVGFVTQSGGFESYTINDCAVGYVADDPAYHSKVVRNSDGTITIRLKTKEEYKFNTNFKLAQVKDKNGKTLSYNYDGSGKLTSITDSKGHQITLNYGSNNLISSITDWSGRSVKYGYDGEGNLVTVTDPNNNTTAYTYDAESNLTTITDRKNQLVLTNTYTDEAKIATQKDEAAITNSFNYDKVSRKITITNNQTPSRTLVTSYDAKGRVLEEKDPLNNIVLFTYGNELAPLTIKDKRGNVVTNTYDTNGNLTSVTYPDTKKVTYQYDANNRLTKIIDGRYGTVTKDTTNTYDGAGNLSQTNESGRISSFTYDTSGEVLTTTDPLNHITTWTRDSFGNALTEVDGNNNTASFEYDVIGRLKKKTDADTKVVTYTYDGNSNVLTQTNAVGTSANTYDNENNLIKVTDPNGAITQYAHNPSDSLTTVTDAVNNQTNYGYDAYQNLLTQQDALNQTTTHAYDQLNRQTQSTTPLGKATKWEYDANGNITKRTDAKNNAISYAYDAFNRLTKITYPDAKTTTFEYDNRGNRTKMIDAIGTSTYTYDNFDRLTQAKDAFNQIISYAYDNADNLTKVTYPGGKAVTYTYDNNDRLIKATDWNLKTTNYTYNKNGTLATKTLPNGIVTSYTYDAANRQSGVKHMKSTTTVANFTYERDAVGNITKASEQGTYVLPVGPTATPTPTPTTGPTATPTPTPGAGGSADLVITNVTFTPTNPKPYEFFTATTTIKNQGTARAYGASSRIAYYYDNPTAPTYQTTYNDFNNISIDLGPGATMQEVHSFLYFETIGNHHFYVMVDQNQSIAESNNTNNLHGPVSVTLAATNQLNQAFAFLNGLTIREVSAQTVPYVTNFTYDPLGRLTSVKYPDNATYSYTFDKVDNRLNETINGQAKNYTYNADNELQQGGQLTYYYDNNGNQTQKTQTGLLHNHRYSYDFENKLTQYIMPNGNTHNFRYDGLGNRLEKEFSTAISRWVYDNSGEMSRLMVGNYGDKYVYGIGLISTGGDSSSSRQYPLEDGLGNTRFMTDYVGNKKKAFEYTPYGAIRKGDSMFSNDFTFQTQQFDDTLNMYYMRARYYDQETGRFITKDPIKGYVTIPQTQNPYAYALNNPLTFSDPSGLYAESLCFSCGLGGGYGAGAFSSTSYCFTTAINKDSKKETGITKNVTKGSMITGYFFGVGITYMYDSQANTLSDLEKKEIVSGTTAKVIGGLSIEGTLDPDSKSIPAFSVSGGLGAGSEIHKGTSSTSILFNLTELNKKEWQQI